MYALIFFLQKIMGGQKNRYFCENALNLVTNHGLQTTNKNVLGRNLLVLGRHSHVFCHRASVVRVTGYYD